MTNQLEIKQNTEAKIEIDEAQNIEKSVVDMSDLLDGENISSIIASADDILNNIETDRKQWDDRRKRFFEKRNGLRPKKSKPWPGCSNISMMEVDKKIKKLIPSYFNLVWMVKNVATFNPDPDVKNTEEYKEMKIVNEELFDHLIRHKMERSKTTTYKWIDKMLQYGRGIIKVTYSFKYAYKEVELDLGESSVDVITAMAGKDLGLQENIQALLAVLVKAFDEIGVFFNIRDSYNARALEDVVIQFAEGKKVLKTTFRKPISDAPKWTVVKTQNIYVPAEFNDIQDSPIVVHKMKWTPKDLECEIERGAVDPEVGMELLKRAKNNASKTDADDISQASENASSGDTVDWNGFISVNEAYIEVQTKNGRRRTILTYSPLYMEKPLSFRLLPYNNDKWPFVDIASEVTDEGWCSPRSIPQKIDYFATQIDNETNARQDLIDLSRSPTFMYVEGKASLEKMQFRPLQGIQVKDTLDNIQQVNLNSTSPETISNIRHYQYQMEDYIAVPDFTLSDPNSPGNQARTASEVFLKNQDRRTIHRVDLELFSEDLARLYQMTWEVFLQYGPSSYVFVNANGQLREWNRAMGNRFSVVPAGTFESTNKTEIIQGAGMALELLANPQTGQHINPRNVTLDMIAAINQEKIGRWTYTDEELGQNQQAQQQQIEAQKIEQVKVKELESNLKIQENDAKANSEAQADIAVKLAENQMEANQTPAITNQGGNQ